MSSMALQENQDVGVPSLDDDPSLLQTETEPKQSKQTSKKKQVEATRASSRRAGKASHISTASSVPKPKRKSKAADNKSNLNDAAAPDTIGKDMVQRCATMHLATEIWQQPEALQAGAKSEEHLVQEAGVSLASIQPELQGRAEQHQFLMETRKPSDASRLTGKALDVSYRLLDEEQAPPVVSGFLHRIRLQRQHGRQMHHCLDAILRHWLWKAMGAFCIFVAVFAPDLFVVWQVESDLVLDTILTVVFLIFMVELIFLTLADLHYFLSALWFAEVGGLMSMIFDFSYLLGSSATEPKTVGTTAEADPNLSMVRVARVSKLIARAGRLARVLRALRVFLQEASSGGPEAEQTCKVITKQLLEHLSTRLSFWSLLLSIVIPLVLSFLYPRTDLSMMAWTTLLNRDVEAYYLAADSIEQAIQAQKLARRLTRFSDFYAKEEYGPFEVCFRPSAEQKFACNASAIPMLLWTTSFTAPRRLASQWILTGECFLAKFDVSKPDQLEALSRIMLIITVVTLMVSFGIMLGSEVHVLTITPMQHMFETVREHCQHIFSHAGSIERALQGTNKAEELAQDADSGSGNESHLLEKVVRTLTMVVEASMVERRPVVVKSLQMTEEEVLIMNFTEGTYFATRVRESCKPVMLNHGFTSEQLKKLDSVNRKLRNRPSSSTELGLYFNSFMLPEERHCPVAVKMIISSTPSSWFSEKVVEGQLLTFVSSLQAEYKKNIFHNFCHAIDVLNMVCMMLMRPVGCQLIKPSCRFGLLVAAIAHDVGHLGLNNMYLIETYHELALIYNDRLPLQNNACARIFQIVKDPAANIFAQADGEEYKLLRKDLIESVLCSDMTRHNDLLVEMGMLYQLNTEEFDQEDPWTSREVHDILSKSNTLLLKALLHAADNNHPMRPWEMCKKISGKLMDEYFAQGDLEKAAGMPVQILNDRERVSASSMQVSFIGHVTMPMIEAMVRIFPVDFLAEHVDENFEQWVQIWVGQAHIPKDQQVELGKQVDAMLARCRAIVGVPSDSCREATSKE